MFEKFTKNSLKNCGLCPSHYLSAPALSWDAMLIMAKAKLELITYSGMYRSFEKGMRGGVSYISDRYSNSNSKYLKSTQNKNQNI